MKAITLRHPWPFAICHLGKPLENRDWLPSLRIGEKFAIHGGKFPVQPDGVCKGAASLDYLDDIEMVVGNLRQDGLLGSGADLTIRMLQSTVGICAVATYGGAVTSSPSKWFCGRYGWKLLGENDDVPLIVLPEPVPCRGAQGLWEVPADVLEKMRAQFSAREDRP